MLPLTRNIVKNAAKFVYLGMWAGLLAACGTVATPPATVVLTNTPLQMQTSVPDLTSKTAPKVLASQTTTTSTVTPSPWVTPISSVNTLIIWWPASLAPENRTAAGTTLREQLARFEADRADVAVTLRIKRASGLGGILDALTSGSVVAPSAMPDLTLMRREDLVMAVAGKLIHPIDLPGLGMDDLFTSGLLLGKIGGIQYGIPYAMEVQHLVYRASTFPITPTTLEDLLSAEQPLLFAANTLKSVNMTLLAQYIAAGGRIVADNGSPTLDREPLLTVLRFYEQAVRTKVVTPQLLDYTTTGQYWPQFIAGKAGIVQTDSTLFLSQRADLTNVSYVPLLPFAKSSSSAEKNNSVSVIDAWMWVLTTSDPDRQTRALAMLKWLSGADQQGDLSQKIGILPARKSALDTWGNDPYVTFARALLENPAAPSSDTVNPIVASQLQSAFEDVLLGRKSADSAADDTVTQVGQLATAQ